MKRFSLVVMLTLTCALGLSGMAKNSHRSPAHKNNSWQKGSKRSLPIHYNHKKTWRSPFGAGHRYSSRPFHSRKDYLSGRHYRAHPQRSPSRIKWRRHHRRNFPRSRRFSSGGYGWSDGDYYDFGGWDYGGDAWGWGWWGPMPPYFSAGLGVGCASGMPTQGYAWLGFGYPPYY